MQDRDLYARILGIESPWKVTDVSLSLKEGEVRVRVEHSGTRTLVCPKCGKASPRYDGRRRQWRHLDTCQLRTILEAEVPRIECGEHGVTQVSVPWAEPGSRFTALFECVVIDWLREASLTAVAVRMELTWDEVDGIQERAVRRGLARRAPVAPQRIGVDETSFQKRHEYVTVFVDLDEPRVLHVADSRKREALDGFYGGLSAERREAIRTVAMDMWGPYIASTMEHVPDAGRKIAFDKFHVAQLLGEAVDEVRRRENRDLLAMGQEKLEGTRYLWLTHPANLSREQWTGRFAALRRSTLKTARAWALREEAMGIWRYATRGWAERGWRAWLAWALRSRLEPVKRAARTVRSHLAGILNAIVQRATNAAGESINAGVGSGNSGRSFPEILAGSVDTAAAVGSSRPRCLVRREGPSSSRSWPRSRTRSRMAAARS